MDYLAIFSIMSVATLGMELDISKNYNSVWDKSNVCYNFFIIFVCFFKSMFFETRFEFLFFISLTKNIKTYIFTTFQEY